MIATGSWVKTAFLAAFKIVMLEGIEVVFIVLALGASDQLILPVTLGAIAALELVVLLGLWLHRPLANVPENALKFGVSVLLAAFGTWDAIEYNRMPEARKAQLRPDWEVSRPPK